MDELLKAKLNIVETCLSWIKEQHQSGEWQDNDLVRRELLLNLEKACQASIDCTSRIIALKNFTPPNQPKEGFDMLENLGVVSRELSNHLKKMLAIRGLVSHSEKVKPAMIESFMLNEVGCLGEFCRSVKKA
tara:strand:- start:683 stop:1078 length:396 start_codon:yes stop_codon:yes gene_type:complete